MTKIYYSLVALVLSVSIGYSQYYYIPFTSPGQNPGGLNNLDEFPVGGGLSATWTSILGGGNAAPTWSSTETIPFTFTFNGSGVANYKVSSSGVLTFSTTATAVPAYTPAALPSLNIPDNSICVWGVEGTGANDEIVTQTFGTAPNRQHWIFFASYTKGTAWTYWSIVLEETTNNIYIVDQRHAATVSGISAGIQLNSTSAYAVASSPNLASTAGADATAADNAYYTFIQGVQPQYDLSVTGETVSAFLNASNAPFTLTGEITNFGSASVNSFDLNYTINGGAAVTTSVTASVAPYAAYNFSHATAWTPPSTGTYTVEMWATNINGNPDGNTSNDRINFTVNVVDNFAVRQTLMEVFTSSTCGPCRPGNENMDDVVVPTITDYTIVKYQQDFPGAGDPYVTQTAVNRRGYYAINSIPRMEIDGQWDQNAASLNKSIFEGFQAVPAFMEFNMNTTEYMLTNVTVDFDIDILEDYPAGNYVVQTAIVEKRTDQNVASNGETEFFYVMMDMLPDENGAAISGLTKGNTINVNRTTDMASTFVEEMSDLKVVVWVENSQTKEVMNSAWADLTQAIGLEESALASANIFPNPANDFFTIELTQATDFNVEVLNVAGQTVLANNFTDVNTATLNTSSLSAGVYLVNVISGTEKATKRLVITK
jgi:hypothetical protein